MSRWPLCLRVGKAVTRRSRLRKFVMEIDENGVLRLKGRIKAAKDVSFTLNRPTVLSGDSSIAKLIIKHYHVRFNHGNHNTVMNEIRQRYYVTSLRSKLRKIAYECQWCRINTSLPKMPSAEGDLPPERLRHHQPPFTCTGVDYFGPMSVTIGRRHEKRYGSLFTCLTTRAVHIELAESLSSDSIILALRRFIARRGTPRVMYSDHGTNFVGAIKELMNMQEVHEKMKKEADVRTITWKFIPPGAPNMGGAWERLVRSVKTALAATLRERNPREEVLHTLLLEAEQIVNSRPLTERLADHFWQRCLREYLPTLVPRRARGDPICRAPAEGDIVLIIDPSSPRYSCPRGRIKKTYPGPDNQVRVVDVETTGGVLRRPTSKIVVLVSAEAKGCSAGPGLDACDVRQQGDLLAPLSGGRDLYGTFSYRDAEGIRNVDRTPGSSGFPEGQHHTSDGYQYLSLSAKRPFGRFLVGVRPRRIRPDGTNRRCSAGLKFSSSVLWSRHSPRGFALVDNMLHLSGLAHGAINLYAQVSHLGLLLHFLSSESQLQYRDTLLAGQ
ncbi:hypothetical protein EVAR_35493_1 [Eumeta japonica]|uniref:Integrase catalytic domain-containing protein n=1 Tax=Eumeta variegata TaxID=151549 RepID=A0A4C1X8Y7_EUMVA|nr:hypothetical protein EVAR_35493_1 [Eumeta japonica]